MQGEAVRLEGLARVFGSREVVRADRLTAAFGRWVALVGPNGSGKTTLLRMIATLTAPSTGDAWIGGVSVRDAPREVRSRIGFVAATDGGFFPRLTGLENLSVFGALRGLSQESVSHSAREWESRLPALSQALRVPFAVTSTGMRQALSLCRAHLHDPEVLVLDEPTRALDSASAAMLRATLRDRVQRGRTVVFATHQADDVRAADEVWAIQGGVCRADA